MPDPSGLTPPILDPTQYPAFLDAQRKQQIAQMLMQSFQQNNQTPENWNSMKVVPRRSPLQTVATLAGALMAGKAQKDATASQQAYFQGMYGANQQPPAAPGPSPGVASPDAPPDPQARADAVGAMPRGVLPPQTTQQTQNPMIPTNMSRAQAQSYLAAFGPEAYTKMLQGTPEWQTALRANNGDTRAAMAQLRAEGIKKGAIANRSGEENLIPIGLNPDGSTKYQTIRTPNLSPDMDYSRNADMSVAEAHNIPGAVAALASQKGATTAADVANTPREIDMGGGVKALRYPGDVPGVGLPPSLRAPQTPQLPSLTQPRQPQSPATAPPPQKTPSGNGPAVQIPQKDANGIWSNNLWRGFDKVNIPNTPGQTTDAYHQALLTDAAKKHSELVNHYGEQSALANQTLQYNSQALQALPAAEVGPMSEYLTHNRGLLIQLAPGLKNALGDSGTVTPTLELNKALKNAALQGAKSTYGRLTQMEVKLQTDEMSPSAGMTRDAIAALIQQNNMRAAYQIQQAKDYHDYASQGGNPLNFESQYGVYRPITRFAAQYSTDPKAITRLQQNPKLLSDFKAKYGWDPTT